MRIDVRLAAFFLVVGLIIGALGFREAQQIIRPVSPMTSGDKSSPLPENAWQLRVNSTYQDLMKTFMGLVTASLVLPLFLIRNFLRVKEDEPISNYLQRSAYWSWALMFLSLLCCMTFFWASAKYLKVVSGGTETWGAVDVSAASFETLRDLSASGSVVSFLAGLLFSGWYFAHHIRKG